MKSFGIVVTVVGALLFSAIEAGCSSRTYVSVPPPPARSEIRPVKPFTNAVWVSGHWEWSGNEYVWRSGQWIQPASGNRSGSGNWKKNAAGKKWVSGHWKKTPKGYVWVDGHWN